MLKLDVATYVAFPALKASSHSAIHPSIKILDITKNACKMASSRLPPGVSTTLRFKPIPALPDNQSFIPSGFHLETKAAAPRSVCLPVPDTTTRLLSQRCKRAAVVESPKTERGRGRRKKHPRQSKTSSEPERLSATFQRSVPIPKRQFRIHKISETNTELALSLTNVAPSPPPSLLSTVSLLVAA